MASFMRQAEAPPREELDEKYQEKGIKALAKEYGTSSYTITRWLYHYGIERREPNSTKMGSIPNHVFAPVLKKLLDDYKMWAVVGESSRQSTSNSGSRGGSQIEVPGYALKAESISALMKGTQWYVSSRRMTAIIKDEQPRVSYQTVDRLLSFLGYPQLWHTDPGLREYYWEGCEKPENWEDHVALVEGLSALAAGNRGDAPVEAR